MDRRSASATEDKEKTCLAHGLQGSDVSPKVAHLGLGSLLKTHHIRAILGVYFTKGNFKGYSLRVRVLIPS